MRALAAITLVAAVLVFAPGLPEQFETPKAAVVRTLGIGALVSAAWIGLAAARRRARGGELGETRVVSDRIAADRVAEPASFRLAPLDWAVVGWLLVEALATTASVSPRLSLFGDSSQREGLLTSLGLAGVYAVSRLAVRGAGERAARALLLTALAAIGVASCYAVLQAFRLDPSPWLDTAEYQRAAGERFIRPFGTAGHPNLLGLLAAAALAAAIPLAWSSDRSRAQTATARAQNAAASRDVAETSSLRAHWPMLLAAALFTFAVLLTLSRGAWIAAMAGVAVGATLAVAARGGVSRSRRTLAWIAVGAVVAIVLAYFAGGDLVRRRLLELLSPTGGTSRTRWEIWRSAFAMWRERPWLGQGPDTFGLVYPRFQTPEIWRFEWGTSYVHAHSILLHVLATRGVLGVAAGAAWILTAAHAVRAAWHARPISRATIAASVAALVALLVAGAFGVLGLAGATWCFALCGALASLSETGPITTAESRAEPRKKIDPPSERGVFTATRGAWIAGGIAALVVASFAAVDLAASRASFEAFEWLPRRAGEGIERSVNAARRAARLAPRNDQTLYASSQALLMASAGASDPRPLLDEAEAMAQRAVALEPARALDHQGLGTILIERARLGDPTALDRAEAEFERAMRLAPYNALAPLQLASSLLAAGRPREAMALARHAAQAYPDHPLPLRIYAQAALAAGDTTEARVALGTLLGSPDRGAAIPAERIAATLDSLATAVPAPAARGAR